ncbi:class I SAM-dependent methyltransferase [Candidatus Parcubacteria bacterium]|jgi:SAM-dependent methyltransferase|nr:MAG: class I SAM-dependent methyltransferase [Candidatus Parcubacteria bacterium]
MLNFILIIVYIVLGLVSLAALGLLMSFLVLLILRVPFVRTPKTAIAALAQSGLITEKDLVYDLGAGDGKFLQELVRATNCRAEGFELSPFFWFLGELRAAKSKKWKMHLQNFLQIDLSEPTVIFTFLAPAGLPTLMHKLKNEAKPGTLIISYGFELKELHLVKIIDPQPENPTGSKFYIYKKMV